jgi:hypothetical protein
MTEQRRLLDRADTDPFKRLLLRSAELDRPMPAVRLRSRALMSALAGSTTVLGAGSSALAGTASASMVGLLKALGVGFAVGVGVMGGVSVTLSEPATSVESRATVALVKHAEVPSIPEAESPNLAPSPEPAAPVAEATAQPPVESRGRRVRQQQSAQAPLPPQGIQPEPLQSEQLAAELTALDEARRAVAAGDAPQAIARLDRMQLEFRAPSLAQEATVVRIEALAKSGAHEAAAEHAARFLRAHPSSPYASRIRRLTNPAAP